MNAAQSFLQLTHLRLSSVGEIVLVVIALVAELWRLSTIFE
jgi:hypothetical protein